MHDLDRGDLVFEAESLDDDRGARPIAEEYEDHRAYEYEGAASGTLFDENEQAELASELLSVSDEGELDQFLGRLLSSVTKKVGLRGPLLKSLGGVLKGAVKKTLPTLVSMGAGAVGGPFGAALASKAAPALGAMFGLELEGLSGEDQEFEAAKQLIKLAGSAAEHAAAMGSGVQPNAAASSAVAEAAKRFAPGLLTQRGRGSRQRGTWYRRGNSIVLVGV